MNQSPFDRIQPQLCVNSKVRRIHRLLNAHYQALIQPYELKGSMLSILFMIGKSSLNQKQIADQLVLDQSTMSRDLKRLESKGLIHRSRGVDARNFSLSISEEGLDLLNEISPKWDELHHRMTEAIGVSHLAALDTVMHKLEQLNDE